MKDLLNNAKIKVAVAAAASGTTAVNTDAIDMAGHDAIVFIATLGTADAGNFVTAQMADDAAFTTPVNITDSKVTPDANGKPAYIELYKPSYRYARLVVTRGVATTVETVHAILHNGYSRPETHDGIGVLVANA